MKYFDDWNPVDCNDCENYQTSTCDGVLEGEKSKCKSYIAGRYTDFGRRIYELEQKVKKLKHENNMQSIINIVLLLLLTFCALVRLS